MQTDRNGFQALASNEIRNPTARVLFSFDKVIDSATTFFTVGVSTAGGPDIIRGEGSVIQEWDKYVYEDQTDRLISVEWARNEEIPYSVTQAICDITLDNHDDFFTPSDTSPVLPRRPVKVHAGFSTVDYPVFVGLTDGLPAVDEKAKTVRFHCVDFLTYALEKPLDEALIYQGQKVNAILDDLLVNHAGLSTLQLDLDAAFNSVPFAFFDKGTKVGDAVRKLVQSDLGSMFMSEEGVIRFRNRQGYDDTSVATFTENEVLDVGYSNLDNLINVVEVRSDVREVQPNQKIWESTSAILVGQGEQVEVWADFSDPVTGVDLPVYITSATTSLFTANTSETGSGTPYANISLLSADRFSKSYKMTFENNGASAAYIRSIQLFGTPAKVTKKIYVREQIDDSVDKYEEHVLTIENEYIQDVSTATSLALTVLAFYSEPSEVSDLKVKGHPAFQLGDAVTTQITQGLREIVRPVGTLMAITKTGDTTTVDEREHWVSKLRCRVSNEGGFEQTLTVRPRQVLNFFTIGQSFVGSSDVIAP